MSRGILIFAHNSRQINYSVLSVISAGLAKKNLNVAVTLVTDQSTYDWLIKSELGPISSRIFENIQIINLSPDENRRNLGDGSFTENVPFINFSRVMAYELTPYDHTLVLDADFLVLSNSLNAYWTLESSFMMSRQERDLFGHRLGHQDTKISETGIDLNFATLLMFKKDQESKLIFDLVKEIKNNYKMYANIYMFDSRVFRNDIAFSIALHTVRGFNNVDGEYLPVVDCILDRDELVDIKMNGSLEFLINHTDNEHGYFLTSLREKDIHVMNKQSIIRNQKKFLELML